MDSIQFDQYTSYSDSSTPRTPSPRTSEPYSPQNFKQQLDIDQAHSIFTDNSGDDTEPHQVQGHNYWQHSPPFPHYNSRGSLLQELYENDHPSHPPSTHEIYLQEPPLSGHSDWSHEQQQQHVHVQQHNHQPVQMHRRNTFPIVRHDRDNSNNGQHYFPPHFIGAESHPSLLGPYSSRPDPYGEPVGMNGDRQPHIEPSSLHGRLDEPFLHSMSPSPHNSFREFDHLEESVKLEDASPVIVPSQSAFYRPPSGGPMPMPMPYLSPHTGLPVQHTDDAASKETQYLRRRCFNCHTTEPPSWRRSTLNPGKIVCNKCGLYERTHLRPRPLRFDELRAGNKARKQTKGVLGSPSPKQKLGGLVKKEPGEFGNVRRGSVSSTVSSAHSGGGTSDWDENDSVYSSSGSAPPSSYSSPSVSTFSIPRDPHSQSPPISSGGIRLPNNPMGDIASMQQQAPVASSAPTGNPPQPPRKAATVPGAYYNNAYPTPPGTANGPTSQHLSELRRGSLPIELMGPQRHPEIIDPSAGWQQVQITDISPNATEIPRQTAVAT